jgi:hypothetical protein
MRLNLPRPPYAAPRQTQPCGEDDAALWVRTTAARCSPSSRKVQASSARPLLWAEGRRSCAFLCFARLVGAVLEQPPLVRAGVLRFAADDPCRKGPVVEHVIAREGHGRRVEHSSVHELLLGLADLHL